MKKQLTPDAESRKLPIKERLHPEGTSRMSLKLKPFLTAALLVAAGVGPARASKRPPKGVLPLFPSIVNPAYLFANQ